MDPLTCCLLGICCPPAQRRQKAVDYYKALNFSDVQSSVLADALLKIVDQISSVTPAQIIEAKSKS